MQYSINDSGCGSNLDDCRTQSAAFRGESKREARGPKRLSTVRRWGATWQIDLECADLLFGPDSLNWLHLESDPRATFVKQGHRRTVWRVEVAAGQVVFAKVYDAGEGRLLSWFRRRTRQTSLEREWRLLWKLRERGVAAVRPLAHGVWDDQKRVLVTEGVVSAIGLHRAWIEAQSADASGGSRNRVDAIILAVARLWASSHERGFAHPDGHPENVLISSSSAPVTAMYVDVSGKSSWADAWPQSGVIPSGAAIRSLAHLDHFFQRRASRAQRLRFWRHYSSFRGKISESMLDPRVERKWLCCVANERAIHAALLARRRDRRLRGDGKYFAAFRFEGGWSAVVTLKLERRHRFPEADVPDRDRAEWTTILGSLISQINAGSPTVDGANLRCVQVHRSRQVTAIDSSQHSSARRLFEHCHRLRHRDIDAPLILGWLERRNGWKLVRQSYAIIPWEVRK